MFQNPPLNPTKRATAAQTLQVVDDLCKCKELKSLHPVLLGQVVVDVSAYFGWDVRDLALQATNAGVL